MTSRRTFLGLCVQTLAALQAMGLSILALPAKGLAQARKELAPGTDSTQLFDQIPNQIDASRLETTPLDLFDTMGDEYAGYDMAQYRLVVDGEVEQPLSLSLEDLMARPVLEKRALLICPGFFSQLGEWRGFSLKDLLKEAGVKRGADHIVVDTFPRSIKPPKEYALAETRGDKIFLAYAVNQVPLPEKHGYPLRLVAEDHFGFDWLKFVTRVTVTASSE